MKKVNFLLFLLLAGNAILAQYKKADSYFTKTGRVYEINTCFNIMSGTGGGVTPSISLVSTLETSQKLSILTEIGMLFPAKYKFTGSYFNGTSDVPASFNGKTGTGFIFKYGAQYRFLSGDGEQKEKTTIPFVKAAVGGIFYFNETVNLSLANGQPADNSNATPQVSTDRVVQGFDFGGGVSYYFTPKIGVKAEAGYHKYFSIKGQSSADFFIPVKNFTYINLGVKIRIQGEE